MGLQDISFRLALLGNDLLQIQSTGGTISQEVPIALPKYHKKEEYIQFIQERIRSIAEDLCHSQKALSTREMVLLPEWCTKGREIIETLLGNVEITKDGGLSTLARNTKEKILVVQRAALEAKQKSDKMSSHSQESVFRRGLSALSSIVVKNVSSFLVAAPKGDENLIIEHRRFLDRVSGGPVASSFATKLSECLVSYIEKQVVHVNERDASLRPSFLSHFYQDPFVSRPKPTFLGEALLGLFPSKKEDLKKVAEVNILFFLNNVYSKLNTAFEKSPYALMSLVHETLEKTVDELKDERRSSVLGSEMGLSERNALLSGNVTKAVVAFFLNLGFPRGSSDLHLPCGFLGGLASEAVWDALQQSLESSLHTVLVDMSEHQDIQEALLLSGYREINKALLTPNQEEASDQVPTQTQKWGSPIVDFFVSIFLSFFREMGFLVVDFVSLGFLFKKKKESTVTKYPHAPELTKTVEEGLSLFGPQKGVLSWSFRNAASTYVPEMAEKLKEFGGRSCINEALRQVESSFLNLSDFLPSFCPRSVQEKELVQQKKVEMRLMRQKAIEQEERVLRTNLPLMAKKLAENLGPDTTPPTLEALRKMGVAGRLLKRIRLFLRCFIKLALERIIQVIFFVLKVPKRVDKLSKDFREGLNSIPQDAFVVFMLEWLGKRDVQLKLPAKSFSH